MYRIVALAAAFLTALHASAHAQNDILSTIYGKGVHSYFDGRYAEAHEYLTTVIDAGTKDPRCYYFRGLSYLKLGREPEAKLDFARGAELEMADTTRFYNVSKALERCQGRARALLERYRADARVAAFRQRERIRYERYERIRRVEPDITLQPVTEEQDAPADDENPAPGINDEPKAEEMPAEDASAEEMPAEEEPAEEDPAPEGEEMPAEETPAEEDPFSEDQDSEDAEAEDAEADDPAAEEPAAAAEDPSA